MVVCFSHSHSAVQSKWTVGFNQDPGWPSNLKGAKQGVGDLRVCQRSDHKDEIAR